MSICTILLSKSKDFVNIIVVEKRASESTIVGPMQRWLLAKAALSFPTLCFIIKQSEMRYGRAPNRARW